MHNVDLILKDEMLDLFCGNELGYGSSRFVYDCPLKEGYVVKIETEMSSRQNMREFDIWATVMQGKHSKWFAEVNSMSMLGRVLIMEKTERPLDDEWPDLIPAYFCDIKRENFGISVLTDPETGESGRRFVCHDYGHSLILEQGINNRMQKVNWKDLNR